MASHTRCRGRPPVDEYLRVQGFDDTYAIGDTSALAGSDGKFLPGLAQVAKQQGVYLGKSLRSGTAVSAFNSEIASTSRSLPDAAISAMWTAHTGDGREVVTLAGKLCTISPLLKVAESLHPHQIVGTWNHLK